MVKFLILVHASSKMYWFILIKLHKIFVAIYTQYASSNLELAHKIKLCDIDYIQ